MRARDLIGRRIVAVEQERIETPRYSRPVFNLSRIVLDNGARVVFSVAELDADYAVEGTVYKPSKGKRNGNT